MSTHTDGAEDMLETMERIAEEQGIRDEQDLQCSDEDDDSFDAEAIFVARGDSVPLPLHDPSAAVTVSYYNREESAVTEGSSLFMGDDEEEEGYYPPQGSFDDSQSTEDRAGITVPRRGSHSSRRSSFVSTDSGLSSQSASSARMSPTLDKQRSTSISRPRRRQSINLASYDRAGSSFSEDTRSDTMSQKMTMKSLRPLSRLSKLGPSSTTKRAGGGAFEETADDAHLSAFMSVGQMGNTQLDDAAAAAAVVALSEGITTSKRIQYCVDDKVLVFLNILNHTNSVDPPEAFTIMPVNKFGFPQGEGKRQEEQQGPYVYVMATVKRVHFDEDVPYYTVVRTDTLAEQRADVAWMEPLTDYHGIEAATRAAHETGRSTVDRQVSTKDKSGISAMLVAGGRRPVQFVENKVVPWTHSKRTLAKDKVRHVIWGDDPFYCKFRITGVNILVLCSFIYLFIEATALAFFPASWDYGVAVAGVVVWSILALELVFEVLIRPSGYFQLILSEKAYAPSTARYINRFHLITESIALLLFIPEFDCLTTKVCGKRVFFSGIDGALSSIFGPTRRRAALGRLCIGLTSLRIVGLVRHWKIMWINRTFRDNDIATGGKPAFIETIQVDSVSGKSQLIRRHSVIPGNEHSSTVESKSEDDRRLKQAATIGTALMVVNSHRALVLIVSIVTVLPIIVSVLGVNNVGETYTSLLQANNVMLSEANASSCEFLESTIEAWLDLGSIVQSGVPHYNVTTYILWAQVLPVRCEFQREDGVITDCENKTNYQGQPACKVWDLGPENASDATAQYFANALGIRVGGITEYNESEISLLTNSSGAYANTTFQVRVLSNENHAIAFTWIAEFLLLACILILTLFGLAVLRGDAGRLVLDPLQRMLKIVVRYAENPLAPPVQQKKRKQKKGNHAGDNGNGGNDALGNYETEQLISAITKIADLLRKCWGVAGAGIISTNLARTSDGMTVVFNPTVPGTRIYAIFAFLAIDGFSEQLRALDRDVMILINDVAKVVHDEVFRWALGNSGQCNKNLGSAFLMVFRIGDFNEVHERKARATDVVFSSEKHTSKTKNLRRRGRAGVPSGHVTGRRGTMKQRGRRHLDVAESLTLESLPGIQTFTDRALLGLLKSFAGIYRDRNLQNWKKDFRLGAGVGAFNVNIMIGMDAGWAVEGAVGSEYKIDATYLSPHVNMASRMMSASKQYGVTLLVSNAVEELLSKQARDKLRHLDTVYVKGSSVAQQVFTYDARHQGVDFFLFERSPEQADMDAEAYSPAIWDTDRDLLAMRQHVTEEFQKKFNEGVNQYLAGNWTAAVAILREADDIMIATVLDEGYIDYNPEKVMDGRIFDWRNTDDEIMRIRHELGDGACRCLINYMERRKCIPSTDWAGVRPLTSK